MSMKISISEKSGMYPAAENCQNRMIPWKQKCRKCGKCGRQFNSDGLLKVTRANS